MFGSTIKTLLYSAFTVVVAFVALRMLRRGGVVATRSRVGRDIKAFLTELKDRPLKNTSNI